MLGNHKLTHYLNKQMKKLNAMLQVVVSFIATHILDEDVFALHIEDFVRTLAKAYAFAVVSKEYAGIYLRRFEDLISPELPEFNHGIK